MKISTKYTYQSIQAPEQIYKALPSIYPLCLDILYKRGYRSKEQLQDFLFPDLNKVLQHTELRDMDKAVSLLQSTIGEKEKIIVYRDYDCDGCCAAAVMLECLRALGADVEDYGNDRQTDGYGICKNGIDQILSHYPDTKLILTVDNGIVAQDAIEYANSKGLRVIVTDHHEPNETLPPAAAIVNPKRKDETYLFRDFCGAGVAFKIMLALFDAMGKDKEPVTQTLDIVALATVADVVPLQGENRAIVQAGLTRISNGDRPFFRVFNRIMGVQSINAHHTLAFLYGPAINSLSRMGEDVEPAVDALQMKAGPALEKLVTWIKSINDARKAETDRQVEEAFKLVRNSPIETAIIIHSNQFTEGIIGIIAGRIKNEYHRPVIVFANSNNHTMKASCRSIPPFHLKNNLDKISGVMLGYGGHAMAAGLSISSDRFSEFKTAFLSLTDKQLSEESFCEEIEIDAVLGEKDLTVNTINYLSILEPYGEAFPQPVLGLRAKCNDTKYMGAEKQHVKYTSGTGFAIIDWNGAEKAKRRKTPPNKFVGFPSLNEWNGHTTVQFIVS